MKMWKAAVVIGFASFSHFDCVNANTETGTEPDTETQTTENTTPKDTKKKCLLIGSNPPIKTSPSLSFCFRNNVSGACCLTGHDQLIRSQYSAFIPEMCKDMFPEFE